MKGKTVEELLASLFSEFREVKNYLQANTTSYSDKEYLTATEAAAFLNIQISYLYKLVHNGAIPRYKPFGKLLFFKLDDLKKFIENGRVKSMDEIEQEADLYLLKSKHQ